MVEISCFKLYTYLKIVRMEVFSMSELLVTVERGPLVESIHKGDIAIVRADGEVISSVGDIEKVIFARSSMKPLQTIPMIETGAADHFLFDDGDLALACASHN